MNTGNLSKDKITKLMPNVIETLQGSCEMLSTALAFYDLTEGDLDLEHFAMIDDLIFNCEICGWWFEMGEQGESPDQMICQSCEDD